MPGLMTKLLPILHVENPDAERRCYEQLGLRTTYTGGLRYADRRAARSAERPVS